MKAPSKPKNVDLKAVFKAVDESNKRFDKYTKKERREFGRIARSVKQGI